MLPSQSSVGSHAHRSFLFTPGVKGAGEDLESAWEGHSHTCEFRRTPWLQYGKWLLMNSYSMKGRMTNGGMDGIVNEHKINTL